MSWFRTTLFFLLGSALVFAVTLSLTPGTQLNSAGGDGPSGGGLGGGGGGGLFGGGGRSGAGGYLEIKIDEPASVADTPNESTDQTTTPKLLPVFFAPLPKPPMDDQLSVIHDLGATRGFHAAAECLSDDADLPFDQYLNTNHVQTNLQPSHMSTSGKSNDWARVGVVSGILDCLDSTDSISDQISNLDIKRLMIEEAILESVVNTSDELVDPIIRAQLLNALDVRWKRLEAEGNSTETAEDLRKKIPRKIGAATNQSVTASWWKKIWSSSILATIGGVLLAILGFVLEKKIQGPVQLAVVTGDSATAESLARTKNRTASETPVAAEKPQEKRRQKQKSKSNSKR